MRSILHPRTWVAAKETSRDVFVLKGFARESERGMRSARPPPRSWTVTGGPLAGGLGADYAWDLRNLL